MDAICTNFVTSVSMRRTKFLLYGFNITSMHQSFGQCIIASGVSAGNSSLNSLVAWALFSSEVQNSWIMWPVTTKMVCMCGVCFEMHGIWCDPLKILCDPLGRKEIKFPHQLWPPKFQKNNHHCRVNKNFCCTHFCSNSKFTNTVLNALCEIFMQQFFHNCLLTLRWRTLRAFLRFAGSQDCVSRFLGSWDHVTVLWSYDRDSATSRRLDIIKSFAQSCDFWAVLKLLHEVVTVLSVIRSHEDSFLREVETFVCLSVCMYVCVVLVVKKRESERERELLSIF